MSLLKSLTSPAAIANGFTDTPAVGTGIMPLIKWAKGMGLVNTATLQAVAPDLPAIFGGYPSNTVTEKAVNGLFIGLFGVYALSFSYILMRNTASRHNFFLYIGVIFYCLMKIVGFATRLVWARDISQVPIGICSVVFIQVASLIQEAMNQVLAHRIFTWRHPETGNSLWMVSLLNSVYFLIFPVIIMAILGQTLPYLNFYTESKYRVLQRVTEAAGVLNLLYAAFPLIHLTAAILFKPGQLSANPLKKNEGAALPPVFQPSWIQSASPFYFVKKGDQGVIYKEESAASAIRIIASREPPAAGRHGTHGSEPMHPNSPRFTIAYLIALISTLSLTVLTVFRCIATFEHGSMMSPPQYWVTNPYVMWIFYGGLEALVCALWLIMRIDLRFYIPDRISKSKQNAEPFLEKNAHDDFSSGTQ